MVFLPWSPWAHFCVLKNIFSYIFSLLFPCEMWNRWLKLTSGPFLKTLQWKLDIYKSINKFKPANVIFAVSEIRTSNIINLCICKGLQNSDFGVLKVDKCSFQISPFFFSLIILHMSCSYTVCLQFFSSIGISESPNVYPPDKCSLLFFSGPLSTAEQELWIVLPYLLIPCGSHYQAFACSSWILAAISVVSCEGKIYFIVY